MAYSRGVGGSSPPLPTKLDLLCLAQPQVCYAEAKWRLMGCYGVGDKVADCIALFALDKTEAFPVDVWGGESHDILFPVPGTAYRG